MQRLLFFLFFVSSSFFNSLRVIDFKPKLNPQPGLSDTVIRQPNHNRGLAEKFFEPDSLLLAQVDSVFNNMPLAERAAQMIMPASSPALGFSYAGVKSKLQQNIAANVLFLKGAKAAFEKQSAELDSLYAVSNRLPPLYACDCEPSLIHRKWAGVRFVGATSAVKTEVQNAAVAQKILQAMKPVRIGLNFAPVADVAENKAIIGNRSYSSSAKKIVHLAGHFVRVMQDCAVAATIKHFPGHGSVKGDTHKGTVYADGELKELNTFKTIIDSSLPIAVLVGHITVKNNKEYGTNGKPATLSSTIIKDLLRQQLNFNGLVVTDAMNMGAVSRIANADYKAAVAGADIIVMPLNAQNLHKQIVKALEKNDELALQFETSIKRVIKLKLLQRPASITAAVAGN